MTSSPISVIIPTAHPDSALIALLGQLNEMDIYEIIIVQAEGASSAFKSGKNCKWLTAPKGRGSQIQVGLDKAKGDILWILHADSIVPETATSEIRRITQDPFTALGCFPLRFDHFNLSLKLFEAFSYISTQLTTFGDQGFFFRREYKDGLPDLSSYPLLEDVILFRSLQQKGRVVKAKRLITTSAARFRRLGIWQTQWRNAVTLWKFYIGVSAKQLYDDYYKATPPSLPPTASLSRL